MNATNRLLSRREFLEAGTLTLLGRSKAAPLVGEKARIGRDSLRKLRNNLQGQPIPPDDSEYDTARRIWNFRFDPHPAAIVWCANPSDVVRLLISHAARVWRSLSARVVIAKPGWSGGLEEIAHLNTDVRCCVSVIASHHSSGDSGSKTKRLVFG